MSLPRSSRARQPSAGAANPAPPTNRALGPLDGAARAPQLVKVHALSANGNQQPGYPAHPASYPSSAAMSVAPRAPAKRASAHVSTGEPSASASRPTTNPLSQSPPVRKCSAAPPEPRTSVATRVHTPVAGLVLGEPLGAGTRGVDHLEGRGAAEVSHEPAVRLLEVLDLEEGGLAPLVELLERAKRGDAVGGLGPGQGLPVGIARNAGAGLVGRAGLGLLPVTGHGLLPVTGPLARARAYATRCLTSGITPPLTGPRPRAGALPSSQPCIKVMPPKRKSGFALVTGR